MTGRLPTLGAIALIAVAFAAGCGTTVSSAAPTGAQELARPPGRPPVDFASVAALEAALRDVAACAANGPAGAQCHLLTATDQVFLLRVFPAGVNGAAFRQAYLANLAAVDAATRSGGGAAAGGLSGPHWAVVPVGANPGLVGTLQRYLGGEEIS